MLAHPGLDEDDAGPSGRAIGLVTPQFPLADDPSVGIELRGLQALGHRVVPLALSPSTTTVRPETEPLVAVARDLDDASELQALTTLLFGAGDARAAIAFARQQGLRPWRRLLWDGARLAALADNAGIDHLHARGAGVVAATAIVAARLLGLPVSVAVLSGESLGLPADAAMMLVATAFVTVGSEALARQLHATAPGRRVLLTPPAVDVQAFRAATLRATPAERRLLYSGQLAQGSGAHDLLEVLAMLAPEARPQVTLAGSGPDAAALQAEARVLGLGATVQFISDPPPSWLPALMAEYDLFMAGNGPAPERPDTAPIEVKAALAAGLPVIAPLPLLETNVVDATCAIGVKPDDPAALSAAIGAVQAMSAAELSRMGHAARRRAGQAFTSRGQMRALSEAIGRQPAVVAETAA